MEISTVSVSPIIAIDDSPDDLFLLKRLVKKTGLNLPLLTFEDASEAVRYLTEAASEADPSKIPCFIFTDIKMPRMTGFEFLEWLRGQAALGPLPVAVLSSSDDERDVRRAKSLHADYFFVKFPSAGELAELLNPVISRTPRRGSLPADQLVRGNRRFDCRAAPNTERSAWSRL